MSVIVDGAAVQRVMRGKGAAAGVVRGEVDAMTAGAAGQCKKITRASCWWAAARNGCQTVPAASIHSVSTHPLSTTLRHQHLLRSTPDVLHLAKPLLSHVNEHTSSSSRLSPSRVLSAHHVVQERTDPASLVARPL